jgi:hypothetical protein
MTDPTTSPEATDVPAAGGDEWADYEGPGAWGSWAIGLLLALFVIGAVATVHSILVTFGG